MAIHPSKQRFVLNIVKQARYVPRIVRNAPPAEAKVTSAYVSVLGVGSPVSSPCVTLTVLRGVSRSYFFNLTRTRAHIGKIKQTGIGADLRGVFFTRLTWGSVTECIRMLLHNRVISKPLPAETVAVLGPPGTESFTTRLFSFCFSGKIVRRLFRVMKFADKEHYEDENVDVTRLHLTPESRDSEEQNATATAAYLCRLQQGTTFVSEQSQEHDSLDIERRLDSLFKLSNSESMQSSPPASNKVKSVHDTASRSKLLSATAGHSPIILVVDCPTFSHFDCLRQNSTVKKHFENADPNTPRLVVHMTQTDVANSESYQCWMDTLGKNCDHIMLDNLKKGYYTFQELVHQETLHKISGDYFPAVNHDLIEEPDTAGDASAASVGLTYRFVREHEDTWASRKVFPSDFLKEMKAQRPTPPVSCHTVKRARDDRSIYPILTVLGSGCGVALPFRAQPCYLLRLSKNKSIVMDCGAQTILRIFQNFGKNADDVLASVRVVFLSHAHLDHHAGFVPLLENIIRAREARPHGQHEKMVCMMPESMKTFYESYCEDFIPLAKHHLVFAEMESIRVRRKASMKMLDDLCQSLGIASLWPIYVCHSEKCYGVAVRLASRMKIVYTSDTQSMFRKLIYEGTGADVLIHDCLFVSSDYKMEATIRKHSYLAGALDTAKAMNAKFVLLNHFSNIYPVVPIQSSDIPPEWTGKVACAYDFLNVSLSRVKELPELEKSLSDSFEYSRRMYEFSVKRKAKMAVRTQKDVERLSRII